MSVRRHVPAGTLPPPYILNLPLAYVRISPPWHLMKKTRPVQVQDSLPDSALPIPSHKKINVRL